MQKLISTFVIFLLVVLFTSKTYGRKSDSTNQLFDQIIVLIENHYVIQERSSIIIEQLLTLKVSGRYDDLNGKQLAETLTIDLKSISQDQHFRIHFSEERVQASKEKSSKGLPSKMADDWEKMERESNYGFSKTELLRGNIGYIKIDEFTNPDYSEDAFAKCLNSIKNADGLILDLNDCIGGSGSMVWLVSSYFFNKEPPTHLTTYNCSSENIDSDILTRKKIMGTRLPNIPIYVLISSNTYSSGESFSYTLKHLKRATLVGESTKGGAHSWKEFILNDSMSIQIPTCRFIHPITKSDWEGKGVQPDIETSIEYSKIIAHIELLKLLQSQVINSSTDYSLLLKQLQAELINKN